MRLKATLIATLGGILAILAVGVAYGAIVKVDGIVLRAEGSFSPSVFPKQGYRPITLGGYINISTADHAVPPALTRVNIYFGNDGRVQTKGLPVCAPERIEGTTPGQARKICGNAIVATGNVEAVVHLPDQPRVPVRAPLTVFNGPPQGGDPTVIFHSYTWFPEPETFVVPASIVRPKAGHLRFHVDVEVPPIADGYGSITHADLKVGREYRYKGRELSYTSARCSDGVFEAHGRLSFATGTVIAGSVYRPCSAE